MLTKEKMIAAMNAVADQVEALCSQHEAEDHDGKMCSMNRMSAVTFMAHRLGAKPTEQAGRSFLLLLQEYAEHCPHCVEKRRAT